MKRKQIAVIGSGISGIMAAYLLQKNHNVTIFEANSRLGGHTHPVFIPQANRFIDTGFIVFNRHTYPRFLQWLDELNLKDQIDDMQMSFSFQDLDKDLIFSLQSPAGLFYQKKNLFNPDYYKMFREVIKFRKQACMDLENNRLIDINLADYLKGYSALFRENLIAPTAAAVWSIPPQYIWKMPAKTYLQFQYNHQYLKGSEFKKSRWMTLRGSSQQYLQAFQERYKGQLILNSPVKKVVRKTERVLLHCHDREYEYDAVFIATHANTALKLLDNPTQLEEKILGTWKYHTQPAILHTDSSHMPPSKKLWSTWNILTQNQQYQVTYYLNLIQKVNCSTDYFISFGNTPIAEDKIIRHIKFHHPIFDQAAIKTQSELPHLNGTKNTYYCGSYFGFGFHEDAIKSSIEASTLFNASH